jgi:adenylate cyclase
MPEEIERKFLIDRAKWAACPKDKGSFLQQGYLLTDPDKTIRVRVTDNAGYLTIKGRNKGARRLEYEYEIPIDEAKELLQQFSENSISKVRYKVCIGNKIWEVDEFQGRNAGLIVAEIELNDEAETFELPDWVTTEVTDDIRYYNSNLSAKPFDTW